MSRFSLLYCIGGLKRERKKDKDRLKKRKENDLPDAILAHNKYCTHRFHIVVITLNIIFKNKIVTLTVFFWLQGCQLKAL